jgi:uncharacterized protein YjcR
MDKIITLQQFIEELGDDKAAEVLGVKVRTVASWRRGERWPRSRAISALIERSGGRLSAYSFVCQGQAA